MEIVRVKVPGRNRTVYRMIVKKREDGRYIVRAPKNNVMIRDLFLMRDTDYGKESLLPIGAVILKKGRHTRRK